MYHNFVDFFKCRIALSRKKIYCVTQEEFNKKY